MYESRSIPLVMPAHDNKIFKKNSYTEKADMQ